MKGSISLMPIAAKFGIRKCQTQAAESALRANTQRQRSTRPPHRPPAPDRTGVAGQTDEPDLTKGAAPSPFCTLQPGLTPHQARRRR